MTTVAVARGFGQPVSRLSEDDIETIGVTTFIVFVIAFLASCFGRISIVCLLLQFTQAKAWRAMLWTTIAFQLVLLLGSHAVVFVQCRPIRAMWADVPSKQCMSVEDQWATAYLVIGEPLVPESHEARVLLRMTDLRALG